MALASGDRYGFDADEPEDENFKRLTAQEAQELRQRDPALSPWWVVGLQCVAGLAVALVAWGVSGKASVGWSAGYGALAVIIPAALFARGLMSQFSSLNAATASFGFFVWEAVKLAVSIAMIAMAPRLVVNLSWLALLVGLLVTLKMYWFALLKRPKPKQI
ncbi:MAG TPA: ATP synthase subunit I [Rhodoferax sp.]|nr:ATP synthase subunit I [Rhodoferax sp.]HNV60757.1 ATP synthase subunit I [Rhodoferax sp.]HPW30773.1 ATP synthase subunit I [Rhodoferax sp.]